MRLRPTRSPSASRRRASAATEAASYCRRPLRESRREEQALGEWHDAETGLFGPRTWARIVAAESARQRRHGGVSTVVVVEIPGPQGQTAGGPRLRKRTLTGVAGLLASMARTSDVVARTGPRRFSVLLPETDEVAAVNFVERVRPQCDAALGPGEAGDHCRFGWADANASRSLEDAVELAVSRLASDL